MTLRSAIITGTANININGTVGATTPDTGKFTTVQAATTMGVGNTTPSASGAGISFPATQSASSDANTLDDYEEGTWTPSVTNMTTTGTPAYGGTYVKVGKKVSVWFYSTTAGGVATYTATANSTNVAGLPFASGYNGTAASGGPAGCATNGNTTAGGFIQGPSLSSGGTTMYFSTTITATQGTSAFCEYYV